MLDFIPFFLGKWFVSQKTPFGAQGSSLDKDSRWGLAIKLICNTINLGNRLVRRPGLPGAPGSGSSRVTNGLYCQWVTGQRLTF